MTVSTIHSFLVHPRRRSVEAAKVGGTRIRLEGKLYDLLNGVYKRSLEECDIDIYFKPSANGEQTNPCRSLLINYLAQPGLPTARLIAKRLEQHTDRRSGLGLLFLMAGKEGHKTRLVLSRFPTDEAILAEEEDDNLSIQFLERVFLKNRFSYKAVVYEDKNVQHGMWEGLAVDRQNADSGSCFSSNYWISDFLNSDLSVTSERGTQRLAVVLKDAANKAEMSVKREIVAAATLATGLQNERISIAGFADRFALSAEAREAIKREVRPASGMNERFKYNDDVFQSMVGFKSIQLDNGGMMTAPTNKFDTVFIQEKGPRDPDAAVQFTTRGHIVAEKLQKSQ